MPRGDHRAAAPAARAAATSAPDADPVPDDLAALVPLSGLDALFLQLESREMPMHVGSLSLLELPPGERDFTAALRRLIGARLHLADAFRRVLVPMPLGLANPAWRVTDRVDLAHHIQRVTLPKPGTQAQLHACVARLHAEPLDRSRPLWQLVVIDGLGGALRGHVGYYAKVHHAAIDGQAGVALAQAMLDTTPQPRQVAPPPAAVRRRSAAAVPTTLAQRLALMARANARQWKEIAALVPTLAQMLGAAAGRGEGSGDAAAPASAARAGGAAEAAPLLAPRTPLGVTIGRERAYATASLPLAQVKAVARALQASINDIVLATCSGALRRWLARHGGVPRRPIAAGVPFSVRASGSGSSAARAGNQVSMMRASLATHLADPAARLAQIRSSMSTGKAVTSRYRSLVPTDYPSFGSAWVVGGLARLATAIGHRLPAGLTLPTLAPVAISNVPGPPVTLYVAGAKVKHYWPASIVVHGMALNITVQSYAEWLDIGLTACRRAVPDLPQLADDLATAFAELEGLAMSAVAQAASVPNAANGARDGSADSATRAAARKGATATNRPAGALRSPRSRTTPNTAASTRRRATPAPRLPEQAGRSGAVAAPRSPAKTRSARVMPATPAPSGTTAAKKRSRRRATASDAAPTATPTPRARRAR